MSSPLRGEMWLADFGSTRGHEQAGVRPGLVVSDDRFNRGDADMVVMIAITTVRKGIPWHVEVRAGEGGLRTTSFIMCDQVRTVARERLSHRLGLIQSATLEEVENRLRLLLDL